MAWSKTDQFKHLGLVIRIKKRLGWNNITEEGTGPIRDMLMRNKSLKKLDMGKGENE